MPRRILNVNTPPFSLQPSDIWVFGGAGYLGRAVVEKVAACGARVLCVDLPGKADALASDVVTPADLDVGDVAAVEGFVREQISRRGVPQGVVIMTFAAEGGRFEDLSAEAFDKANHGNLTATFMLARSIGQAMAERGGGSIVLFSSMYGSVSPDPRIYEVPMNVNPVEYGVGKAGVQQMARYLAVHWGPRGVRCNAVSPGPFPNPAIQANEGAFIDRLSAKVPLRRIGQAAEIAGAVAFLLSDEASFVTAINLPVDGGWTAW